MGTEMGWSRGVVAVALLTVAALAPDGAARGQCEAEFGALTAGRAAVVHEADGSRRVLPDEEGDESLREVFPVDRLFAGRRLLVANVLQYHYLAGFLLECLDGRPTVVQEVQGSLKLEGERLTRQGYARMPDDAMCCPSVSLEADVVLERGRFTLGAYRLEWNDPEMASQWRDLVPSREIASRGITPEMHRLAGRYERTTAKSYGCFVRGLTSDATRFLQLQPDGLALVARPSGEEVGVWYLKGPNELGLAASLQGTLRIREDEEGTYIDCWADVGGTAKPLLYGVRRR